MTDYERPTERPDGGVYKGFDHIEFYVTNAKIVADWYVLRMGFEKVAYKGLETGSRDYASWVVQQGDIKYVFTSSLNPQQCDVTQTIAKSGDFAKDVAFCVEDTRALYEKAIKRGGESVREPVELKDEHGTVVVATIKTYGDTVHTFVQRDDYKGAFLPGFVPVADTKDPLGTLLPSPGLLFIDHVVGNQPDAAMTPVAEFYERVLDFHRFWSVDDKQIHTRYSSLRSIVMTDFDRKVKMPINEPANGMKKSQIQEYVDYHGGAGVQHIAMRTENILHTVANMHKRGVSFLKVPKKYYDDLRVRLSKSAVKVAEDLDRIEELDLLVDFDDQGYLLQIFTKPVEDRPTLFFEVIQRRNHEGFGAGNFKALFESIEREQADRGNL